MSTGIGITNRLKPIVCPLTKHPRNTQNINENICKTKGYSYLNYLSQNAIFVVKSNLRIQRCARTIFNARVMCFWYNSASVHCKDDRNFIKLFIDLFLFLEHNSTSHYVTSTTRSRTCITQQFVTIITLLPYYITALLRKV